MFPDTISALAAMKAVLIATVAIGVSGGLLAWRERPEPGAVPLAVLLASQSWWSATLFFRITATGVGAKMFWVDVSWVGVAAIPVAWLFFSLEYTGYSQYVRPRYVALASAIPVATMLLGVTNDFHGLLYVGSTLVEKGGAATLNPVPGFWFWVIAAYTYVLGLLGALPLLQFVTSEVDTFRGQSLAILFGLFAPWVTNALYLAGMLPTAGIDPTPVAFALSGVAYLGALTRFQLFGTSPAPIRQARRTVFERMQEGALVLDRHDHVVDMNDRAAEIIGRDPGDVLGRPVDRVIPNASSVGEAQSGRTVFRPGDGQGAYDVSINQLRDARGRVTGQIITLHDISDHLRHQQRLEVLNRAFRHNIRTNTQVIVGNADYLADHNSEARAAKVRQNALEIEEISEKIRTVLDVFERQREPSEPVELGDLVRRCVESVGEDYPEVTIECTVETDEVYVDGVMEDVFLNLVENAAEHNTNPDPRVWVDAERDGDHARVVVADNGPGIESEELALATEGTETPLKHGSGFGLAVVVWGTEITGGEVTFEENDPTGLVVTVEVPQLPGPDEDVAGSHHPRRTPVATPDGGSNADGE